MTFTQTSAVLFCKWGNSVHEAKRVPSLSCILFPPPRQLRETNLFVDDNYTPLALHHFAIMMDKWFYCQVTLIPQKVMLQSQHCLLDLFSHDESLLQRGVINASVNNAHTHTSTDAYTCILSVNLQARLLTWKSRFILSKTLLFDNCFQWTYPCLWYLPHPQDLALIMEHFGNPTLSVLDASF